MSVTPNISARNNGNAVEKPMAMVRFLVVSVFETATRRPCSELTWLGGCFFLDVVSPLRYGLHHPFHHMRTFWRISFPKTGQKQGDLQSVTDAQDPGCARTPATCTQSRSRDERAWLCVLLEAQQHTKYDNEARYGKAKRCLNESRNSSGSQKQRSGWRRWSNQDSKPALGDLPVRTTLARYMR